MERIELQGAGREERQGLTDERTGFYNRRGFASLARQMASLAVRRRRDLLVVRAELDGLRTIHERFGPAQGEIALADAAQVILGTFRKSDVLSRVEEDNFVIMAIETRKDSGEVITSRLQRNLERYNESATRPFRLSLSAVAATFDPGLALTEEAFVENAKILLGPAS